MPDEREVFTLQDMVENFDVQRVSLGGPIFDVEKLNWLNGQWIKALTPGQLLDRLLAWKMTVKRWKILPPPFNHGLTCCLKRELGRFLFQPHASNQQRTV